MEVVSFFLAVLGAAGSPTAAMAQPVLAQPVRCREHQGPKDPGPGTSGVTRAEFVDTMGVTTPILPSQGASLEAYRQGTLTIWWDFQLPDDFAGPGGLFPAPILSVSWVCEGANGEQVAAVLDQNGSPVFDYGGERGDGALVELEGFEPSTGRGEARMQIPVGPFSANGWSVPSLRSPWSTIHAVLQAQGTDGATVSFSAGIPVEVRDPAFFLAWERDRVRLGEFTWLFLYPSAPLQEETTYAITASSTTAAWGLPSSVTLKPGQEATAILFRATDACALTLAVVAGDGTEVAVSNPLRIEKDGENYGFQNVGPGGVRLDSLDYLDLLLSGQMLGDIPVVTEFEPATSYDGLFFPGTSIGVLSQGCVEVQPQGGGEDVRLQVLWSMGHDQWQQLRLRSGQDPRGSAWLLHLDREALDGAQV